MMLTLGSGIGVALFDDGVLVRNLDTSSLLWAWTLPSWTNSPLPPPETPEDDKAWAAWADRVETFIAQLVTEFSPTVVIIGGAAQFSYKKWTPLMKRVRNPSPQAPRLLKTLLGFPIG
eukprot:4331013-Pyramimonas_sp.AAC.1